jgi:hypothetical protein
MVGVTVAVDVATDSVVTLTTTVSSAAFLLKPEGLTSRDFRGNSIGDILRHANDRCDRGRPALRVFGPACSHGHNSGDHRSQVDICLAEIPLLSGAQERHQVSVAFSPSVSPSPLGRSLLLSEEINIP